MNIKISKLKEISDTLFHHLNELGVSEIEISNDYYWHIDKDLRYDPLREPSGFSIGQLSEDWERLQDIGTDENPSISYAFVWLSSILLAIGEKVVR